MAESAWGWLGKTATAVKQASEKVQQSVEALPTPPLADMNMNIGKALGKIMSSGDATGDAAAAPDDYLPWAVPRGWAQRSEAWVALSKGMVEQEATFLIGPERGLTKLETQTLKLQGVTVDFNTESAAADYDRISSAVLDYAPLSKMRFNLVPKYISEDSFWLNYVWKLHEVAKTDSVQVETRALLRVLNVQREDYPEEGIRAPGSAKVFAGLSDRTALLDAVDALVRTVGEGEERRVEAAQGTRQQAAVLDLYGEGTEALQMLDDCLADARRAGVLDDMTRCFYDTCCSCRERLRIEVEEGEGAAVGGAGVGGGGGGGGEFSKLMHLVTRLDAAVAAYDAFAASPSPAAESPALGSAEKKRPAAAAAPHRTSPKPSAMPAPPEAPPALDEDDEYVEETAVVATAAQATAAVAAPALSPLPCAGTESTSADSFVHVSRDGLSGALALPEGGSQAASSPVSADSPPAPPQAAPSSVEATAAAAAAAAAAARPGSSSSPSNQFSALPWDSDDDN